MKNILHNLILSLDNKGAGFSGKKLTAMSLVACVMAAHIKWIALGDFSQLVSVLTVDFGFISVLFGINEYGKKNTPIAPAEPKKDGDNPQ
jgi:hypothetical protein